MTEPWKLTAEDRRALWGSPEEQEQKTSVAVVNWADFLSDVRRGMGISRFDSEPVRDGKLVCSDYTRCAALMLASQSKWWESLGPETQEAIRSALPGLDAETVTQKIQVGIARAVYGSAAMEIFSWQPLATPIGAVAHFRVQHTTPDQDVPVVDAIGSLEPGARTSRIPELRLDIAIEHIDFSDPDAHVVETRAVQGAQVLIAREAVAQVAKENDSLGQRFGAEVVNIAVAEAFARWEREAISTALIAGRWHTTPALPTISLALEFEQSALLSLNQVGYQIHRRTMRGPANAIIVGPEVAVPLMEFRSFSKRGDRYPPVADMTRLHRIGNLDGRYRVYCDPLLGGRDMLLAYVGPSLLDRGVVLAPWIVVFVPTPEGLNVRLRAATKLVAAEHFQVVTTC